MKYARNRNAGRLCLAILIILMITAGTAMAENETESSPPAMKVLKMPYAFYNDSFGASVGFVYGATGFPQPQSYILGTVIAGSNDALAFYFLSRDIRIPHTRRLFFDVDLALSKFGTIRSYINGNPAYTNEQAGSNDSDKNNYIEGRGDDNFVRIKFKYLLPIGGGVTPKIPVLDRGLPAASSSDEGSWNPLISGRTFLELRPYWREQIISTDNGDISQKTNGMEFSVYRDNTDFARNPSRGELMRVRYTRDWGWSDSSQPYEVADFELSKYFSLGSTDKFRQRVIAADFWTADALSWDESSVQDGQKVYHRPPGYLGANLGGLFRMRAYPTSRFNDQAVVYYSLEYRLIPEWNPFADIDWIKKHLDIEWWQLTAFAELGRVSPDWNISDMHTSMKWDAGLGLRVLAKGMVARIDIAGCPEGYGVSMMVGQPFMF